MKKFVLFLAAGLLAAPMLSGCSLFGGKESATIKSADDFKMIRSDTKAVLENDIEIFAGETLPGNRWNIENVEIDGNGHKIRIIGNDGKIGCHTVSIFSTMKNAIIKNLTIDVDMKVIGEKMDEDCGVIANTLSNSILYNVDVNLNKGLDLGGFEMAHGALVGYAKGTYITKCDVTGDLDFFSEQAGGLIGYAKSCVIDYNTFKGTLNFTHNGEYLSDISEYGSCFGGIAGYIDSSSTLIGNTANIESLRVRVNDKSWRSLEVDTGGIVGISQGTVEDNKVNYIGECPLINSIENNSSFARDSKIGLLAGYASGNRKINNNFVDLHQLAKFTKSEGNYINPLVCKYDSKEAVGVNYLYNNDRLIQTSNYFQPEQSDGGGFSEDGAYQEYTSAKLKLMLPQIDKEEEADLTFNYTIDTKRMKIVYIEFASVQFYNMYPNEDKIVISEKEVWDVDAQAFVVSLRDYYCNKHYDYYYDIHIVPHIKQADQPTHSGVIYYDTLFDVKLVRRFVGAVDTSENGVITNNMNDVKLMENNGPTIIGQASKDRWIKSGDTYNVDTNKALSFDEALKALDDIRVSEQQ